MPVNPPSNVSIEEECEESIGDWMIKFEQEERVKNRIACEELGYPMSEARYATIKEWEEAHGENWYERIANLA